MFSETAGVSSALLREVKAIAGPHRPEYCYQCAKCTSGCTANKVLPDYKPHLIVALTKLGRVEELLKSGIVWACTECLKCTEHCPQDVAPADVVLALKNIAVRMGIEPPKAVAEMARNVVETGRIFTPMEVMTKDFELVTRDGLKLPSLKRPYAEDKWRERIAKFMEGVVR